MITDRYEIRIGRHQEILPQYPDNSFGALITDPPYGIRFMNKHWDYQVPTAEDWQEPLRVLKPGAFGLVFCGTRTQHRMVVNLEDAGFEVRDIIAWLYGSGFPKSTDIAKALDRASGHEREDKFKDAMGRGAAGPTGNKKCTTCGKWLVSGNPCQCPRPQDEAISELGRAWEGWGTALKPAMELITLVRKPLEGTYVENITAYGTGALNIDACRVPTDEEITNHSRGEEAALSKGKYGDSKGQKTHKTRGQELGRFPANVIHDGSDEVVEKFPHTRSGDPGVLRKMENTSAAFGAECRPPGTPMTGFGDSGSAARFFYVAKPSPQERHAGTETNQHPTVKPIELMRYLVRMITPPGELVLDPYAGSGSTGAAALIEGRKSLLIDNDPGHEDLIRKRMQHFSRKNPPSLFDLL